MTMMLRESDRIETICAGVEAPAGFRHPIFHTEKVDDRKGLGPLTSTEYLRDDLLGIGQYLLSLLLPVCQQFVPQTFVRDRHELRGQNGGVVPTVQSDGCNGYSRRHLDNGKECVHVARVRYAEFLDHFSSLEEEILPQNMEEE